MRKAILLRVLASLLPLFTGMAGVINGPSELPTSFTLTQRAVTYGVLAYGIAGLVLAMLLLIGLRPKVAASRRRRRATLAVGNTWGAIVVLVGTVAPVAFGETSWWVGAASFVACALVIAGALWLVRAAERTAERGAGNIPQDEVGVAR